PDTDEASIGGLLSVYRPSAGPAEMGAGRGGLFAMNLEGLEGQARRMIWDDLDVWHWENVSLPAGVRSASFRHAVSPAGIAAVARFGPEGIEGKLSAGPFQDLSDALLQAGGGPGVGLPARPRR